LARRGIYIIENLKLDELAKDKVRQFFVYLSALEIDRGYRFACAAYCLGVKLPYCACIRNLFNKERNHVRPLHAY